MNNSIRIRVAGIALNKKNEVLLVNHQKHGRSYWLFPGGGVEYGETLAQALKREFKEELSSSKLEVKNLVFLNETIYPRNERHILNLYFRVKLGKGFKIKVNPDKVLKNAGFVGMKDFKKFLFYPDLKSAIISQWKKGFSKGLGYMKTKWKK
jgi:8-oxo-dGTP diphosphatase